MIETTGLFQNFQSSLFHNVIEWYRSYCLGLLPCKYLNVHSLNCLSLTLLKSGLPCSNLEECQDCASALSDKMSLEIKNFKFLLSAERSVQDDQYSGIRWQFWCRDLVEALSWCHAVWNLPPVATMMRRRRRKFTKTMGRTKTTTVTETRQKRSLSWLSNSPTQMIAPVILLHDKYSRTQQENLLREGIKKKSTFFGKKS